MLIWRWRRPDFFQGKTLSRRTADLVLLGVEGRTPVLGLPDSGVEALVIAPDLSNLPAGQKAVSADGDEVSTP